MFGWAFPVDEFVSYFPEFSDSEKYPPQRLQLFGEKAMLHITPDVVGMPMQFHSRHYALFLMTGHLLAIDDQSKDSPESGGTSIAGAPFKATVGSVNVETAKQNTYNSDDWNWWLGQTKYGRELLAYLELQAPVGVFLNNENDSVRDLI